MDYTERRLAENEVIFKDANKVIKKAAKSLFSQAQQEVVPIGFYCECSDIECRKRIDMLPAEYEAVHANIRTFCVLPDHNVEAVERVSSKKGHYWVVEKYETPPAMPKESLGL